MRLGAILTVVGVVVLSVAFAGVLQARHARDVALARADSLAVEWEFARRSADALADSLNLERERTTAVLAHLETQRRRADSLAAVTMREAAKSEAKALETGETLAETLSTARRESREPLRGLLVEAEKQLAEHLEADRETTEAFRRRIAAALEESDILEEMAFTWRDRAVLAERALKAKEIECNLCREENQALRSVKEPGFFGELVGHAKAFGAGVGTVLLILVVAG